GSLNKLRHIFCKFNRAYYFPFFITEGAISKHYILLYIPKSIVFSNFESFAAKCSIVVALEHLPLISRDQHEDIHTRLYLYTRGFKRIDRSFIRRYYFIFTVN